MIIEHFCSSSNKSTITNSLEAHTRADIDHVYKNTNPIENSNLDHKAWYIHNKPKKSYNKFKVNKELVFDLSRASNDDKTNSKLFIFYENFEILKSLQYIGLFEKCMWGLNKNPKVTVIGNYIDLSDFRRCNNQLCPICGIKTNIKKRHKINKLIELNNYHNKGSISFLTITGFHYLTFDQDKHFEIMQKSLTELIESSDWNYDRTSLTNKNTREFLSVKTILGLDFCFSSHDYTYSTKSGHHNHFHIMLCGTKRIDNKTLEKVESIIRLKWEEIYFKNLRGYYKEGSIGKSFKEHSIKLLDSTKNYKKVTKYLTKTLSLPSELTSIIGKKTKLETSSNLRDLYLMLSDETPKIPRKKLEAVIHSYISSTKGKRLGKFISKTEKISNQLRLIDSQINQARKDFMNKINITLSNNNEESEISYLSNENNSLNVIDFPLNDIEEIKQVNIYDNKVKPIKDYLNDDLNLTNIIQNEKLLGNDLITPKTHLNTTKNLRYTNICFHSINSLKCKIRASLGYLKTSNDLNIEISYKIKNKFKGYRNVYHKFGSDFTYISGSNFTYILNNKRIIHHTNSEQLSLFSFNKYTKSSITFMNKQAQPLIINSS